MNHNRFIRFNNFVRLFHKRASYLWVIASVGGRIHKSALFAEMLRDVMRVARAGGPLPRPRLDEPTLDFLRRTVLPALRDLQASGRSGVVRLVASEGTRFPELAEVYRKVAIEPVLRLVRLFAMRAERRGELRSNSLSRLPILLVAPVVTATLWNSLFAIGEPLDLADVFEAYLDLVFTAQKITPTHQQL